MAQANQNAGLGILAWLITVLVGSSWQLATRHGVTTSLAPMDLALLRYTIPAVVLTPLLLRKGVWPRLASGWALPLIVIGGGLPFGLLGMIGARFAPVSHMGALLPGSMPLFVALLCALVLGERFARVRLVGLGVILGSLLCIVGQSLAGVASDPATLIGDLLFLSAGVFWAIYTIAFRKSGLDPWHGAALICFWSAVCLLPVWMATGGTKLLDAPLTDVVLQAVAQGFLAGLIGLAAYGTAIRHLGASLAAVSGAAVPVVTAVGGVVLLGESLSPLTGLAAVSVAVGIWLFAGGPGFRMSRGR